MTLLEVDCRAFDAGNGWLVSPLFEEVETRFSRVTCIVFMGLEPISGGAGAMKQFKPVTLLTAGTFWRGPRPVDWDVMNRVCAFR